MEVGNMHTFETVLECVAHNKQVLYKTDTR